MLQQPGISGVRVYFASYTDNPNYKPYTPDGCENLMTLVFSPTSHIEGQSDCDLQEKNQGVYYILIPDDKGESSSGQKQGLLKMEDLSETQMVFEWINHYRNNKVAVLESAPPLPSKYGETLSLWFSMECINNWYLAITYPKLNITHVVMALASYNHNETIPPPNPGSSTSQRLISNQLSLIISIKEDGAKTDIPFFYDASLLLNTEEKNDLLTDPTYKMVPLLQGYYDTGKPCPPPTGGCS